jgi:hypothetical protein
MLTKRAAGTGRPWRTRISVLDLVLAAFGIGMIYLALTNLGAVIAAARPGDGTPGTFTARQVACVQHPGHQACTWYGDFQAGNGPRRGKVVHHISLYGSNRDSFTPGQSTPARDIGRPGRVYGPDGSREWMVTAVLLAAGAAIFLRTVLLPIRRRWSSGPGSP